jgi:hypothetical protein
MRGHKPGMGSPDQSGEQLLRELDLLQSREPAPEIEPPRMIDQAVRNMARRELPDSPTAPPAGTLRWIAGLATVSIALIAVGISMVQSPPYVPPPAAPALRNEQQDEPRPESPAESSVAEERGAISAAGSARSAAPGTGADQAPIPASRDAAVSDAKLDFKQQAADPALAESPVESMSAAEASKTNPADDNSDMDEARAESAQAWLDLIRQLYDQGLLTEAAEQLRAFRTDHPEYPLPDWAAELQP